MREAYFFTDRYGRPAVRVELSADELVQIWPTAEQARGGWLYGYGASVEIINRWLCDPLRHTLTNVWCGLGRRLISHQGTRISNAAEPLAVRVVPIY